VPFTVWAPESPPLGGTTWVAWSPPDPRVFPQVTIDYLPARAGRGISLIEGAHRGRAGARPGETAVTRAGRRYFVRELGGQVTVRVLRAGTDVQVSGGPGRGRDALIAVAASLRRVS
jgi:hypothetical protein